MTDTELIEAFRLAIALQTIVTDTNAAIKRDGKIFYQSELERVSEFCRRALSVDEKAERVRKALKLIASEIENVGLDGNGGMIVKGMTVERCRELAKSALSEPAALKGEGE